jgi:hypothetical protein
MIVAVIAIMTVKAPLVKLILVVAVRDRGMVAVLGGLSIMHVPRAPSIDGSACTDPGSAR